MPLAGYYATQQPTAPGGDWIETATVDTIAFNMAGDIDPAYPSYEPKTVWAYLQVPVATNGKAILRSQSDGSFLAVSSSAAMAQAASGAWFSFTFNGEVLSEQAIAIHIACENGDTYWINRHNSGSGDGYRHSHLAAGAPNYYSSPNGLVSSWAATANDFSIYLDYDAATSDLVLSNTGVPDGTYRVILFEDDTWTNEVFNGDVAFSSGGATIECNILSGNRVTGFVVDNEAAPLDGAVLTGVTV